jgi:hypothetical protein
MSEPIEVGQIRMATISRQLVPVTIVDKSANPGSWICVAIGTAAPLLLLKELQIGERLPKN